MNTLIETANCKRNYGMVGIKAIVDHVVHGRILIQDGFGGMEEPRGGTVRWAHGQAHKLKATDTFESLAQKWNDEITCLQAIEMQVDDDRPWIENLYGQQLELLAQKLGL